MKAAIVDTDILGEITRARNATVIARARTYERAHSKLTLSVLTVFETLQGLHKAGHLSQADAFRRWLTSFEIVVFDLEAAMLAGEIAGALLRAGRTIGVVDIGLAATAIRCDRVLVTGNNAHFEYVREAGFPLEIDSWRSP